MKLVIIGGGSYVFAPMAIYDAIAVSKMTGEIALVDVDETSLAAMKGYAEKMAETERVDVKITAETDRTKALPGADYVILSAAVQGKKRWLAASPRFSTPTKACNTQPVCLPIDWCRQACR